MKITEIVVTSKETVVSKYFYKALGKIQQVNSEALAVALPGDPSAISIIASGSGKKYKLLGVSGITMLPDRVTPKDGDILDFNLVFEKIDDDVKKIDVVEGDKFGNVDNLEILEYPIVITEVML